MGAYTNPLQSGGFMRSVIPRGEFYPHLYDVAMQCDKDNIHDELLDWADVVLMMHNSAIPGQKEQQAWLVRNWAKFKKFKNIVVWRSIGQSTPSIETELQKYVKDGLKILRYSVMESNIPEFAGADDTIYFSEDPNEFKDWTGDRPQILTVAQSFKRRGEHLGFSIFDKATSGFNRMAIGTDNEDLNDIPGGQRTYHELKEELRHSRCFFYYGTQPAPYTLTFIEAFMTGVPIVAVGTQLRKSGHYSWQQYEIPQIIENGVNGYVCESVDKMRNTFKLLLEDKMAAETISVRARNTALKVFDRKLAKDKWTTFLKNLKKNV
jgi:hypothetical protein